MDRMKDKVILITGGARGIGRAIVEKLASEGAELVISCGTKPATFEQSNVRHEVVNVTDREAVKILISKIKEEFGRIDVLINNAGITKDGPFVRMSEEAWDDVIEINLKGAFNVTQAVAPLMTKNKKGSIISLSSVIGLYGNIGQTNYSATKGGLIAMTKSWAKELARKGAQIRANCVAPGFIVTSMTENLTEDVMKGMLERITLGRLGTTEDVANVVLFLASDESSYITGQTLEVSGGISL